MLSSTVAVIHTVSKVGRGKRGEELTRSPEPGILPWPTTERMVRQNPIAALRNMFDTYCTLIGPCVPDSLQLYIWNPQFFPSFALPTAKRTFFPSPISKLRLRFAIISIKYLVRRRNRPSHETPMCRRSYSIFQT